MATKRKGKTVPCEGCRERKKKCSAGQPCERCKRLGIQCYYLKPVAPPKLDYIDSSNNQEIQMHVEVLEDIMRNMERELYLLKAPFRHKQISEHSHSDVESSVDSSYSDEDLELVSDHEKSLGPLTSIHKDACNWKMRFRKNGGISIQTDILSYANLLKHIEALGNPSNTFPIIKQPTLASLSAGGGYLQRRVLPTIMRRGNFRAILSGIQSALLRAPPETHASPHTLMIEVESDTPKVVLEKKDLALELVNAYFSCRYLHRVVFHQKTFYNMFVKTKTNLESSPVVCALAAAVLTMRCRHVMTIVPYDQHLQLGEYYFNKARFAVSLQFDEPSMETMIAYLYMGIYKANLLRPQDANLYLETAIRIRQILTETTYKDPPKLPNYSSHHNNTNTTDNNNEASKPQQTAPKRASKSKAYNRYLGEYETFKRLHAGFQDAIQFIQFVNNKRGVPVKNARLRSNSGCNQASSVIEQLFRSISAEKYRPKLMPDENRQTMRAIMKEHYISQIAQVVGPYFKRVRWSESSVVPLSLLLKTEEDLKHVYNQDIPLEFRLAPSIFEDGIDGVEFKKRLREDGRCDIVSISIAARFYQSLQALHEPFLPLIRRRKTLTNLSLVQEAIDESTTPNKRKRPSEKSNRSPSSDEEENDHDDDDDDDDEEDNNSVLSVHSLRAQEVCFKCAIIIIRLLEFQSYELDSCTLPLPILLSCWDILIRNSCLGMDEEEMESSGVKNYLSAKDIELSREYAVRCIEVLRRGYLFNAAERSVYEHYERIESELMTALCKCASPTAKYWEPVSNWP